MNKPAIFSETKAWVAAHIASHKTAGQDWPDMAEYAVKFNRYHPKLGWGKTSQMEFFLNKQDMSDWAIDALMDIVNGLVVAYQVYEWDWGPKAMPGIHHLVDQLPPTEAERAA